MTRRQGTVCRPAALSCSTVCAPPRHISLTNVVGCGTGAVNGIPAEPTPAQRVRNLTAQRLVPELVAVLEIQQPQQCLRRNRRPSQPDAEQLRQGDEPLVVQVRIDLGQLGR